MKNKLKAEMEKIKMSDKTKERIIAACEETARNKTIKLKDNDEYTDYVYKAERVKPKNNIIRFVSAAAACAVVAAGIGATGIMMNRNGSVSSTESTPSTESVSVTETTEPVVLSPFGDFTSFDYKLDNFNRRRGQYSDATYSRFDEFLNKFDWGDELTENVTRTEEQIYESQRYHITWTKGDTPPVECMIRIDNDGFVTYQESMMSFETGEDEPIESRYYKIDFDAFESAVNEILKDEDYGETTLGVCEKSPFSDILAKDYKVAPFTLDYVEATQEQRDKTAELFDSQTWYEFDGLKNYYDWTLFPNRNNFLAEYHEGSSASYISTFFDDFATVYNVTYDDNGRIESYDWKFYTCKDLDFGEKLTDIYNIEEPDPIKDDGNKVTADLIPPLTQTRSMLEFVSDENTKLSEEKRSILVDFFENHELNSIIPNTFGPCYGDEMDAEFDEAMVAILNETTNEMRSIYISKDRQFLALYDPDDMGYATAMGLKIYKVDGLEELYNKLVQ